MTVRRREPVDFDWNDLKILLAYLRAGSLKAPPPTLAVNASTVSRRLVALEQRLGARLFERTRHGLVATEITRGLLVPVERAEAAAAEVVRSVSGGETEAEGVVCVALTEALATHVVVPELPALRSLHPRIAINLLTGWRPVDLVRHEADLAIRSLRPRAGDLTFRQLATIRVLPLASARYLARHAKRGVDDLDWIRNDVTDGSETLQWIARHLPDLRPVVTTNSLSSTIEAVLHNLGVAFLPALLQRRFPQLRAVELALPEPPTYTIYLVTHRDLRHVPRVAAVWDFLVAHLGPALAGPPS